MFKKKKKHKGFNNLPNKSKLDQVLWFIENYLPQKKDRGVQKKLYMDNLEAETIKKFSKLVSMRSKTLFPTTKNTTISFTFGNWALPYSFFKDGSSVWSYFSIFSCQKFGFVKPIGSFDFFSYL